MHENDVHFLSYTMLYFSLTMDNNLCWGSTTIRLFFCPPHFQSSQFLVQIVVVMLFCSVLEINDVELYCIVLYYCVIVFQSVTFKKTSRTLARSMWWKNIKLTILLVVVVIVSMLSSTHCTFTVLIYSISF